MSSSAASAATASSSGNSNSSSSHNSNSNSSNTEVKFEGVKTRNASREKENILLLGMVYAKRATNPARGQEFRDRARCEALEKLGFCVK